MKKIGNGKHPIYIHEYKGFTIEKTGTRDYPWNIYKNGDHVGFGRTVRDCKTMIDDGCFDDD